MVVMEERYGPEIEKLWDVKKMEVQVMEQVLLQSSGLIHVVQKHEAWYILSPDTYCTNSLKVSLLQI